jgi:glycine dehydrogenase subunit 1
MSWLGPQGLRELAVSSLRRAHATREHLAGISGVEMAFTGPYLKEFAIRLPSADVAAVVGGVCDDGYLIGPVVDDPAGDGHLVMVAATERRTTADITGLVAALERQLEEQR